MARKRTSKQHKPGARGRAKKSIQRATPGQSKTTKGKHSRNSRENEAALLRQRLQHATRELRRSTKSLAAAARSAGLSESTLRRFVTKNRIARKQGKKWVFYKRGKRAIRIFSDEKSLRVTVNPETARAIGRYLSAVGQFLETNDRDHLKPFIGVSIKDSSGKEHVFETRPNVLYRLNAAVEPFEEIYRILT